MSRQGYQIKKVIEWTNNTGGPVTSGTVVVVGDNLGVAAVDLADGESGSVHVDGAHEGPKVSSAVIAQGEEVIWDVSAGAFEDKNHTPATGDISKGAVAWSSAGSGTTTFYFALTFSGAAEKA